ncbi:hypothetical protein ANO11243_038240 [Dothideomycetidae sp. 11243]|nr:hypothetical protein ANO11243_038240 [fungal sp. No.11243]
MQVIDLLGTVTCIDPRVFPEKIFGLNYGEVFIFRTLAGRPYPVFEEMMALGAFNRGFDDIIIMYHTDCGANHFDDDFIRQDLSKSGPEVESQVANMRLPTFKTSAEQHLREDIAWMKKQPLMREDLVQRIKGYMFDIKTGKLQEVV